MGMPQSARSELGPALDRYRIGTGPPRHVHMDHALVRVCYIGGLLHDCSALAMELLQSCTKPSIWQCFPVGEIYKNKVMKESNENGAAPAHIFMY